MLRVAEDSFNNEIEAIARRFHADFVRPFCDKNGLRFLSGNGTFIFMKDKEVVHQDGGFYDEWENADGTVSAAAPDGWALVLEICNLSVPPHGNGLGSCMPSDADKEKDDGSTE